MQVKTSILVGWFRGDQKQCTSVFSPFFPPKKGEKTEKCQRGLKTASKTSCLVSEFFIILGRNVVNGSNPIILVKKLAKMGLTNNTGRKWLKLIYTKRKENNLLILGGNLTKSIVLCKKN